MTVNIWDILHALVAGNSALLNDAGWVAKALELIERHKAARAAVEDGGDPEPNADEQRQAEMSELEAKLAELRAAAPAPAPVLVPAAAGDLAAATPGEQAEFRAWQAARQDAAQ